MTARRKILLPGIDDKGAGHERLRLQRRVYGNIRSRLQMHIRRIGYAANGAATLLECFLGCDAEELVRHIESQMLPGMTWSNYAADGWHIDHIKHLSGFDFDFTRELKVACHYTNLQPLWAKDNIRKGGSNRKSLAN
jgi:hypothetical protein